MLVSRTHFEEQESSLRRQRPVFGRGHGHLGVLLHWGCSLLGGQRRPKPLGPSAVTPGERIPQPCGHRHLSPGGQLIQPALPLLCCSPIGPPRPQPGWFSLCKSIESKIASPPRPSRRKPELFGLTDFALRVPSVQSHLQPPHILLAPPGTLCLTHLAPLTHAHVWPRTFYSS